MDELIAFLNRQFAMEDEFVRIGTSGKRATLSANTVRRLTNETTAKRRLLEQFKLRGDSVRATVQPSTGGVWEDLLRILASMYADRPDYREEWRPSA